MKYSILFATKSVALTKRYMLNKMLEIIIFASQYSFKILQSYLVPNLLINKMIFLQHHSNFYFDDWFITMIYSKFMSYGRMLVASNKV